MNIRIKDHEFFWDDAKAALNLRKHGVSFELAAAVFADTSHQTIYDSLHSHVEERWTTIGRAANGPLIAVVHTIHEFSNRLTAIRLISARHAQSRDRYVYERNLFMVRETVENDLSTEKYDPRQFFRGGHHSFDEGVWRMSIFLDKELLMYFIKLAAKGTQGPTAVINAVLRRERDRLENEKRAEAPATS